MDEDGLQFRAEIKILAALRKIKRLDPHAIARQHQPLGGFGPQRHREHAAHPREAIGIPLEERLQHGFGIAVGMEPAAAAFQFGTQFQVIVDLAVERDHGAAGSVNDGLIAAVKVDDFQPRRAKRNCARFKNALLIRPAMNQRPDGILNAAGMRQRVCGA